MDFVYIVMTKKDGVRMVVKNKTDATRKVDMIAFRELGLPALEPIDFDGSLMRYGWADKCWWQREVVY
jgi:hypothetical protein